MQKEKFNELIAGVICLSFILGVGIYTGFFNKKNFLDELSTSFSAFIDKTGIRNGASNIGSKKVDVYNGYKPQMIKKQWLEASGKYRIWNSVFTSPQKVIFYMYEKENDSFHVNLSKYLAGDKKISAKYIEKSMTISSFRNAPVGLTGPSKICNSLEECNAQRVKATAASEISNFLENCGKTMCIINPSKAGYVRLGTRNVNDAIKMINGLRDW